MPDPSETVPAESTGEEAGENLELFEADPKLATLGPNVTMSNELVRSAQDLNLFERRLIALGIANTNTFPGYHSSIALHRRQGWEMSVSALEYSDNFNVSLEVAYKQLARAAKNLRKRSVQLVTKRARNGAPIDTVDVSWVWKAAYVKSEARVVLSFTPDIAPHVIGLSKRFTIYQLRHAAGLDTEYAWRLFGNLCSWSDTCRWTISIEEFIRVMGAPQAYAKDFGALRRRIVLPSVASVNAKSDLKVDWRPLKEGERKVAGLEFTFAPKVQGELALEPAA